jgi:3',5'-cyclic AMP phosphodiesterase CpdA
MIARACAVLSLFSSCYLSLPDRYASERPVRTERAPRASAQMQRECGSIEVDPSSAIARAPYVANVSPRAITVMWTTRSARPETFVVYGPDELDDTRHITPVRVPLRGSDETQLAAHAAELTPNAVYCYELRDRREAVLYGPIAFRTAPPAGSREPIDLIVLGDSGGGGDYQRAVRDRMTETRADLVLHVGDLAYPNATVERMDSRVFAMYAPLLRSIPFLPVIGNHDVRGDGGAAFDDVFALPNAIAGARYYAFDWGMLHIAALDTERDLEQQARWLEDDLSRTRARWVIVMGHRPMRSSGIHGAERALARTIAPVIARHRVPLVLAGHDHHYERLRPIDGTTFIVTGGGGHSVRSFLPGPDTAIAEPVLHFVHLHVDERAIRVRAIDATGTVFDAFTIEHDAAAVASLDRGSGSSR